MFDENLLSKIMEDKKEENYDCPRTQRHTHEFLGSVKLAELEEEPHNHRFACITGEAFPLPGGNHFHRVETRTDFYEDHFHILNDNTGPAISVGDGRHVHFISGQTAINDGHRHEFIFATLIENPIGD